MEHRSCVFVSRMQSTIFPKPLTLTSLPFPIPTILFKHSDTAPFCPIKLRYEGWESDVSNIKMAATSVDVDADEEEADEEAWEDTLSDEYRWEGREEEGDAYCGEIALGDANDMMSWRLGVELLIISFCRRSLSCQSSPPPFLVNIGAAPNRTSVLGLRLEGQRSTMVKRFRGEKRRNVFVDLE